MMQISVSIEARTFEAALDRIEALVNDASKPLRVVAREMEQQLRGTFRAESDPWGAPWPPHSPVTIRLRAKRGNSRASLLIDTGRMYASIANGATTDTAEVSMGGEGMFPDVHQFGNPANKAWGRGRAPIPARPMFPIRNGEGDAPPAWWEAVAAPIVAALEDAAE